jgi:hypothetical protein
MNDWYFAKDGAQHGPVVEHVLREMLASGELPAESLVWREGMAGWQPAAECPAFAGTAAPVVEAEVELSPYAPPAAAPASVEIPIPVSGDQVRPWIRYWARTLDTLLFALLLGFALGVVYPAAFEIHDTIFNILILGASTFIEAAFLSVFSTTPGKALLRVRVCNRDGTRLSYGAALGRSFQVFLRGLGLGIPLAALITQIVGYQTLTRDGITSWDRMGNHVVAHQEIPAWRSLLIVLAFVGLIGLVGFLTYLGQREAGPGF